MGREVEAKAAPSRLDEQLELVFCREIARQANFGLIGIEQMNHALQHGGPLFWFGAQAALVAAGNVSKLLWPPKERIVGRGEQLRELIGISDDHFLQPRTFRNHFEHFDERLERWAGESERRNFVDENILPAGAISGIDPGDYLRNFDPGSMVMTFRGDAYPVQTLADALVEVGERAAPFTEPRWLRERLP